MWESILTGAITGLIGAFTAYIIAKKLKNDVKNEIFEFFETQEGMIFVASLGKMFAAGAMSVLKVPMRSKNINLFGFKIPTEVVMALLDKSGLLKGAKETIEKSFNLEDLR